MCKAFHTLAPALVYHVVQMPSTSSHASVVDQQLLLQFGGRLKSARLLRGLSTVDMAKRAGLSRMTLRAIEAGEPTPTIGSYLRVMRVLGVSEDLALLASEARPNDQRGGVSGSAAGPAASVASHARHELQDIQSLALHHEAVRLMKKDPDLIRRATETLDRWRSKGDSRSQSLWDEWSAILHKRAWRRALSHTQRSRELRQASPLATVLPEETRQQILKEVQQLRSAAPSSA